MRCLTSCGLAGTICSSQTQQAPIATWTRRIRHTLECLSPRVGGALKSHLDVATILSKYCAYLVVSAPKLLPGNHYDSSLVFDAVAVEAAQFLRGVEDGYEALRSLPESTETELSILRRGVKLARQLEEMECDRCWKVLADFWSEMLLYIAPSENVKEHIEALANGGEFITHWQFCVFVRASALDRFQTVDRRALRGRGPRLDRGRGSWRGRGGRFDALEKCLVAVNRSSVFRENVAAPTAVAHGVVYDNKWTEAEGTIILNAKQTAQKRDMPQIYPVAAPRAAESRKNNDVPFDVVSRTVGREGHVDADAFNLNTICHESGKKAAAPFVVVCTADASEGSVDANSICLNSFPGVPASAAAVYPISLEDINTDLNSVAIEFSPATNIHAAIPNVSVEQIHEHVRGAEHSVAQLTSPGGADGSGALVENFSLQGKNLFNGDVIFNHDNVDPFLYTSRHGDFNIVHTCMDHGGGTFNMITSLSEALNQLAQSNDQILISLQDYFKSKSLSQRPMAREDLTQVLGKRVVSDEDTLSKAQRLAAKRNLEISEYSFLPFKPKVIATKLNNVGIRLGRNDKEVLTSAISIKNIEVDRLMASSISSPSIRRAVLNEEDDNDIDEHLSHAIKRWDENSEHDDLEWGYDLSAVPCRKKANHFTYAWRVPRPSKKPITPSKISLK
ncbi:hypothetical protein Zm00014a_022684 [Zea mays]|uniref:Uncharacterized protein n=1 Tax=Zea mays TaxID=4577 RepID=A0A3L6G3H9_MAIZE|nr:hypothetical protein Zm00014a_022684 [Zea mays]